MLCYACMHMHLSIYGWQVFIDTKDLSFTILDIVELYFSFFVGKCGKCFDLKICMFLLILFFLYFTHKYLCPHIHTYMHIHMHLSITHTHIQGPPNIFKRKLLNIFSNCFFYLKVQSFRLIMKNSLYDRSNF